MSFPSLSSSFSLVFSLSRAVDLVCLATGDPVKDFKCAVVWRSVIFGGERIASERFCVDRGGVTGYKS